MALKVVEVPGARVIVAGVTVSETNVTGCDEEPPQPQRSKASISAAKTLLNMVLSPVCYSGTNLGTILDYH